MIDARGHLNEACEDNVENDIDARKKRVIEYGETYSKALNELNRRTVKVDDGGTVYKERRGDVSCPMKKA